MFAKFKKKKHESEENISVEESTLPNKEQDNTPKKKMQFKAPEMVLVGGLILIVWGLFSFISGGTDEKTVSNENKEVNTSKEEKPPFVYENSMQKQTQAPVKKIEENPKEDAPKTKVVEAKDDAPFVYENSTDFADDTLEPPPPSYAQDNTALAKTVQKAEETTPPPVISTQKNTAPSSQEIVHQNVTPKGTASQDNTTTEKAQTTQASKTVVHTTQNKLAIPAKEAIQKDAYICRIVDDYTNILGKEIMYYIKDKSTHKYTPAYALSSWDESGILVKKRFVATQVDVRERMVEVDTGKWIPALEFMTCTLVEESTR